MHAWVVKRPVSMERKKSIGKAWLTIDWIEQPSQDLNEQFVGNTYLDVHKLNPQLCMAK